MEGGGEEAMFLRIVRDKGPTRCELFFLLVFLNAH
jgi:hypothetical protein